MAKEFVDYAQDRLIAIRENTLNLRRDIGFEMDRIFKTNNLGMDDPKLWKYRAAVLKLEDALHCIDSVIDEIRIN